MLMRRDRVWSGFLLLAVAMAPLGFAGAAAAQDVEASAPAKAAPKRAAPKTAAPAKAAPKKAAPAAAEAPEDLGNPESLDAAESPEVLTPDTSEVPMTPDVPDSGPAAPGVADSSPEEAPQSTTPPPDGAGDRKWGTVIIAGGAVLGLTGAALLIRSKKATGKDKSFIPILMMGAGALGCIPGIALLNSGEAQQMKYDRWKEDQSDGAGGGRLSPALVWNRRW